MGSKIFDGVLFVAYSRDHPPPHIHGIKGEGEVIVELLGTGRIRRAERRDAVRPSNAKEADVRRILTLAAEHADELHALWEKARGTSPE